MLLWSGGLFGPQSVVVERTQAATLNSVSVADLCNIDHLIVVAAAAAVAVVGH